jgi:hypothetical protein
VGIIFDGQPDRFTFVTVSPSIPAPVPITFTVVSISRDDQGLVVRQLALPNLEPLDRVAPVLVDSTVMSVRFRYRGEEPDAWKDQWDMSEEDTLPRAVEILLAIAVGGRAVEQPPLVVPIRTFTP